MPILMPVTEVALLKSLEGNESLTGTDGYFRTKRKALDRATTHEQLYLSRVARKPVFRINNNVLMMWLKPAYAAVKDGYWLEISDFERKGIILSM